VGDQDFPPLTRLTFYFIIFLFCHISQNSICKTNSFTIPLEFIRELTVIMTQDAIDVRDVHWYFKTLNNNFIYCYLRFFIQLQRLNISVPPQKENR